MMDKEELREWARTTLQDGGKMGRIEVDFDSVMAAANYIRDAMTEPRMDEIEWDDEKHRFAVAERCTSIFDDPYNVLMLRKNECSDYIRCLDLNGMRTLDIFDDELTPTGERYILQGEHNG